MNSVPAVRAPQWSRHRWKLLALVVVLAVALPVRRAWQLYWATPAPNEQYLDELNGLLRDLTAGQPNALPLYLAAFKRHQEIVTAMGLARPQANLTNEYLTFGGSYAFEKLNFATWDDPRFAEARRVFDALKPAIDMMQEASFAPMLAIPYDRSALTDLGFRMRPAPASPFDDPHISVDNAFLNHLAGLGLALVEAARKNSWNESLKWTESILCAGRQWVCLPAVGDWMTGLKIYGLAIQRWAEILHLQEVPASVCQEVAALFDSLPFPGRPHATWVEAERIRYRAFLSWIYSSHGQPVTWPTTGRQRIPFVGGQWKPRLQDRFQNVLQGWAVSSLSDAQTQLELVFEDFESAMRSGEIASASPAAGNFHSALHHPALREQLGEPQQHRIRNLLIARVDTLNAREQHKLFRVMLALEAHHATHQHWPKSLEELHLPSDAIFDDEHQMPFVYHTDIDLSTLPPPLDRLHRESGLQFSYMLKRPGDPRPIPVWWPLPPQDFEMELARKSLDPAHWQQQFQTSSP